MTQRPGAIAIALSVAFAFVLAGCTGSTTPTLNSSPEVTTPGRTVKVETGSITPVVSLAADVRSGVQFHLSAPADGTFVADPVPAIRAADGSVINIVPAPGVHLDSYMAVAGDPVVAGLPIASATATGFALVAPVEGADLLRFTEQSTGARAQIDGGGAPFDCVFLDSYPTTLPGDEQQHFMACLVPGDQRVVNGLSGIIAFGFPGVDDVPVLPVEAVAGTLDSGSVYAVHGESVEEVPVTLGVSDGVQVQILSGIDVGDMVRVPSPSLLNG